MGETESASDDLCSIDLQQLIHLPARRDHAPERHIPRSAVHADIHLAVTDCEQAILDGGANKAGPLSIPKLPFRAPPRAGGMSTHIVSGHNIVATKKTFLPPIFP
jgi:hypothetical protein